LASKNHDYIDRQSNQIKRHNRLNELNIERRNTEVNSFVSSLIKMSSSISHHDPHVTKRKTSQYHENYNCETDEIDVYKTSRYGKRYEPSLIVKKKPWLLNLEKRLDNVKTAMQQRRCNYEKCRAEENALKMAICVRHRLDDMSTIDNPVESIIDDLENEWEEPVEKLWQYLVGNPKNNLSFQKLNNLSELWKDWLERNDLDQSV
jgi:hypothetical protein